MHKSRDIQNQRGLQLQKIYTQVIDSIGLHLQLWAWFTVNINKFAAERRFEVDRL